jgi:hypothetical protein
MDSSSTALATTWWSARSALQFIATRVHVPSWSSTLATTVILLSTSACNIAYTARINLTQQKGRYKPAPLGQTVVVSAASFSFLPNSVDSDGFGK